MFRSGQRQRHHRQFVDYRFQQRAAGLGQVVHPQPLRRVVARQPAGGGDGLEQGAEHRRHEVRQRQLPEPAAVDRPRHLDQRGHELLFADEHGVVDPVICLFVRVATFERLACRRIRVRIAPRLPPRLAGGGTGRTVPPFGRVGVLVAHVEASAFVGDLALQDVQVHADAPCGLAGVQVVQRPVADLGDQWGHGLDRAHLPGGEGGVEPPDRRVDDEVVQRFGPLDQRAHRLVAAFDAQVAGVEVVVGHGHEGLAQER